MSDLDRIREEMQHDRETRIRPLDVRRPDGRGAAYSGGVELAFELSKQGGTTIDTNPAELRVWAERMLRFADEIDGKPAMLDEALDLLHDATSRYRDNALRRRWAMRRKALVDRLIDAAIRSGRKL